MPKFARLFALLGPLLVAPTGATPKQAQDLASIEFHQRLGAQIDLDISLVDETGRVLKFADIGGRVPLLLVLGYFHCKKLCSPLREEVMDTLAASGLTAGRDYRLLFVSVDPQDTPADAGRTKAESLARFHAAGASDWLFLTGEQEATASLARSVGFDYDLRNETIAHPIGAIVLTPGGVISSYFLGLRPSTQGLRTALAQAAVGRAARLADPVILLCFDLDPGTGRYSPSVMKLLRLLAGGFALGGAIALARAVKRGTPA